MKRLLLLLIAGTAVAQIPVERTIDWQNWSGVPGGIPIRTNVFCNVRVSIPGSGLLATGNGTTDDAAALQAAINLCPSNRVIYLPNGRYRINSALNFKSGVTFRGESSTNTFILYPGSSISEPLHIGDYNDGPSFSITAGVQKGGSNCTVSSSSGLAVRDYVIIDQRNYTNNSNDILISQEGIQGGDNDWALSPREGRNQGQIITITGISGNNITFWPPTMWYMTNQPQLFKFPSYIEWVGFENFATSNLNAGGVGSGYTTFYFRQARYCWMTNIVMKRPPTRNLQIFRGANLTIHSCDFIKPSPVGVNQGYLTEFWDTCSFLRFENNLFVEGYSGLEPHTKGGGHVLSYNFTTNFLQGTVNAPYDFVGAHGGHIMYCLWEGNNAFQLFYDGGFGSSSHNAVFRNYMRGYDLGTASEPHGQPYRCFQVHALHRFITSIGNVLGALPYVPNYEINGGIDAVYETPYIYMLGYEASGGDFNANWDSKVESTMIRHINWDSATTTNGGRVFQVHKVAQTNLQNSYYLASKPGWFQGVTWPPYDPYNPNSRTNWIPAQYRFNGVALPAAGPEPPVTNDPPFLYRWLPRASGSSIGKRGIR